MRVRFHFGRVFGAADQAAFKRLSAIQRFGVMLQIVARVRGELDAFVLRGVEPALFAIDARDTARVPRLRQISVIDREAVFNKIMSQARGALLEFLELGGGRPRESALVHLGKMAAAG
jgi:hypothetical protein